MKIEDLKNSPYKFKVFLSLSIVGLVILLFINFYILPTYMGTNPSLKDTTFSVINNITALILSSLGAILFLYYFTPKVMNETDIKIIMPSDLKNYLNYILNNTKSYSYLGHTARWTRSTTLPKLYSIAKAENDTKIVNIVIINPNKDKLLNYYKDFGHGQRSKGNKIKEAKDVQKELLTTILICYLFNKKDFFQIKLYLSSKISLFRIDMSEDSAIMTKPYPLEPGVMFYKKTFFYKSYAEEIKIAQEQSKLLDFNKANFNIDEENINIENTKKILKKMKLKIDNLDDEDIISIIDNAKRPVIPF